MEMNPFKPLIQFYQELCENKLYRKRSINKINLRMNVVKAYF